MTLVEKR